WTPFGAASLAQYKAAWIVNLSPKPTRSGLQHGPCATLHLPESAFLPLCSRLPFAKVPLFRLFTEIYAGHMGIGPEGKVKEDGHTCTRKAPHHGRIFVLCSGHHLAVSLLKTAGGSLGESSYIPKATAAVWERSRSSPVSRSQRRLHQSFLFSLALFTTKK